MGLLYCTSARVRLCSYQRRRKLCLLTRSAPRRRPCSAPATRRRQGGGRGGGCRGGPFSNRAVGHFRGPALLRPQPARGRGVLGLPPQPTHGARGGAARGARRLRGAVLGASDVASNPDSCTLLRTGPHSCPSCHKTPRRASTWSLTQRTPPMRGWTRWRCASTSRPRAAGPRCRTRSRRRPAAARRPRPWVRSKGCCGSGGARRGLWHAQPALSRRCGAHLALSQRPGRQRTSWAWARWLACACACRLHSRPPSRQQYVADIACKPRPWIVTRQRSSHQMTRIRHGQTPMAAAMHTKTPRAKCAYQTRSDQIRSDHTSTSRPRSCVSFIFSRVSRCAAPRLTPPNRTSLVAWPLLRRSRGWSW